MEILEKSINNLKENLFVCFFFSLLPLQVRDDVYHSILTNNLPNLLEYGNINALTNLWYTGQITNFEYLTHLNKHAGRSLMISCSIRCSRSYSLTMSVRPLTSMILQFTGN